MECGGFQWKELGSASVRLLVNRLSGDESGKKVVVAISLSMRGNAMEWQRGKDYRNGLQPS